MSSAIAATIVVAVAVGAGCAGHRLLTRRPYARADDPPAPLPAASALAVLTAVEVALAGSMTLRILDGPAAILVALAVAPLAVAAQLDLDVRRVPDLLLVPALALAATAGLVSAGTATDRWRVLFAGLAAGAFVAVIGLAARRMTGGAFPGGDVAVAVCGALLLGAHGWGPLIVAGLVAFVSAGVAGLIGHGRGARHTVALAPHLVAGLVVALVLASVLG